MTASPEDLQKEVEIHRGGYLQLVQHRIPLMIRLQIGSMVMFILWRVGGLMLLGMALMKWGVFSASRPGRDYGLMLAIGYGAGLPLAAFSASRLMGNEFELIYFLRQGNIPNYFASVLVAFGHTGLIMLLFRSGVLKSLLDRLSAVGRTAFSNYLLHSVICTTLFYGYGLGWYGYFGRSQLVPVVLAVWASQLLASPIWLRHFRFGPAEWLWRSLTYGKAQPLRRV